MKYLLSLLLGLGAVSVAACNSVDTAEVQQDNAYTLTVTGMV